MISYIVTIVFFIFMEGLFSGSEIALFSVNKTKLKYLAKKGDKTAKKTYRLLQKHYTNYISVGLIGTILSIVIATAMYVTMLHELSLMIPIIKGKEEILAESLVVLTLLFGEIIPKSIFQHYADRLIFYVVPFLEFFRKIFTPILLFSNIVNKAVFFLFNIKPSTEKSYTREDIINILYEGVEDLDEIEKRIISNILIFNDRRISEIVIPLSEVVAVSDDKKVIDLIPIFKETGFSRLPVYRRRVDQIIGFVRSYDLIHADIDEPITKYMKGIRYIPEFANLSNVLKGFKTYKDHMAVVVDERGATMGIITLKDVLEEIVGQIKDDFTRKERQMIKSQTIDKLIVDGRMEIKEIESLIDIDIPDGSFETVNGLITYTLGRMPRKGESITIGNYKFQVLKVEKRRVLEVLIEKIN